MRAVFVLFALAVCAAAHADPGRSDIGLLWPPGALAADVTAQPSCGVDLGWMPAANLFDRCSKDARLWRGLAFAPLATGLSVPSLRSPESSLSLIGAGEEAPPSLLPH